MNGGVGEEIRKLHVPSEGVSGGTSLDIPYLESSPRRHSQIRELEFAFKIAN